MGSLDAFHFLTAELDYPMLVVTASDAERKAGCLVGFATQASIDPPRLLVLLSKANYTYRVAAGAKELVVHFLSQSNMELAKLFGEETGDRIDKFARCQWQPTAVGTPVLSGTLGWVAGRIADRYDAGDHVAHLVEPTDAEVGPPGDQLGSQAVRDLEPGHPA